MGFFSGLGKIVGKVGDFLGGGNPLVGLATSAIGSLWQNQQSKDAAGRQMDYQTMMSNTAYQRAMADMKAAGLNPILAGKVGGASTPSGASYQPQNVGSSALSGGVKGATTRNILEQNNNLQANSALQRSQTAQSMEQARRLKLENDAYSVLSPEMRAFVLSGSGVASGIGAANSALKASGGLKNTFMNLLRSNNNFLRRK